MTCAQIAIIPRNKVSEASATASSTTARTMTNPHAPEQAMNIVHGMFQVKRDHWARHHPLERGQKRTHSAGMGEEQSSGVGTAVEPRSASPPPPRFSFYIDIFGYCNLRCPTCPVGNWEDDASVFHHGMMSRAFLETILDKAKAECTIAGVALFNWTEPRSEERRVGKGCRDGW